METTGATTKTATLEDLTAGNGKRRFATVDLPVSGLTVRIRSLTERELSTYQAAVQSARDESQRQQRMTAANRQYIALCVVDDDGNRIISDKQAGRLADMDAADSSHLYDKCATHTGINNRDVEDLVGNSKETTTSDSPTS